MLVYSDKKERFVCLGRSLGFVHIDCGLGRASTVLSKIINVNCASIAQHCLGSLLVLGSYSVRLKGTYLYK